MGAAIVRPPNTPNTEYTQSIGACWESYEKSENNITAI